MPELLISVLFERGAFTAQDTQRASLVLQCYAIGLPAYIAVKVFSTVHWARHDTKTPVKISVAATVINIALSIALINSLGVAGIALATGVTGWLQLVAHIYTINKIDTVRFDLRLFRAVIKISISCAVMAGLIGLGLVFIPMLLPTLPQIILLTILVLAGMLVYFGLIFATGVMRLAALKTYFSKRNIKRKMENKGV